MKKLLIVVLTIAMLLTLPVGVFGVSAAEGTDAYTAAINEEGNLALGKNVYVNYSQHTGSGFGRQLITDGDLNGNYGGNTGVSWHSGDSTAHNRPTWFAIDLGEKVKIDTVVLYPRTNGNNYDSMANAVRILAVDDPTILDENLIAQDKRSEWAVGDTWIGDSCKNPDWVPYSPTGTVVYEQFDMDLRNVEAEPITMQFEEVETQYLVVYGLSLFGQWRGWTIAECAVYNKGYTPEAGVTNLAEGKEVTASSSHEDGPWSASKLTDGNRYNMNESLAYPNDYGQYTGYHSAADGSLPHDGSADVTIDINLGAKTAFDTFTIWPSTAKYSSTEDTEMFVPANYEIQISDDGNEWDTIVTVTDTEVTEYAPITHTFTAVEATLVRFVAKGVTKHIKLSEFEITNSTSTPVVPEEPSKLTSGDDIFGAHYQTRDIGGDKHDMRIVLVANLEKLFEIKSSATVTVTFVLESGAEVYVTGVLGGAKSDYGLYQTVTASGDVYEAAEGYALFGNVVTGIPNDAYTSVSVSIVDDTTNATLLSATSN